MQLFLFLCISVLFMTVSCSKYPKFYGDTDVAYMVDKRVDCQVEWRYGSPQDDDIIHYISRALSEELTAEKAIQIALLNNPQIQATFENLGISRANLIEAGLLSNPSFEIELRYPRNKGLKTNIEYLITTSVLDLFLIPLRTKLATTDFEQTKLRISNEILDLAFQVRSTFYELVAERKKIFFLNSVVELSDIIQDISSKQNFIGNINSLDQQLSKSRFLEAKLEYSKSQADLIGLTEKMNRLLGFSNDVCLILPNNLSDIDYYGFDLCSLESIALENRLDLQVARLEVARLSELLGLNATWTYTKLQVGLAGERDPDGTNVIGPGFSGEIPLFNYGQASRMRLFAELRQAQDKLAELEIKALSEVREAHKRLLRYLKIIKDYQNQILPLQEQIAVSSEQLYNIMGLGIDQLLENKHQEIVVLLNYNDSLKKYAIARVDLDKALGGYLFKLLSEMYCANGEFK